MADNNIHEDTSPDQALIRDHLVLPSHFAPRPSSKENKTLVSKKKMKQRPGLCVSRVHPTRERRLPGFRSADRELPADTGVVAWASGGHWGQGSSEEWLVALMAGVE